MTKSEERAREVKAFVEQIYKNFGVENAQASAIVIEESGKEHRITSFWTAEPAKVTVDNRGNVEIILCETNLFLMGMMFTFLKFLIKTGMEESGYCFKQETFAQETFYFLEFSYR